MQRYLQRFLNNIILGNPTDSNLQEEDYPILIQQVLLQLRPPWHPKACNAQHCL